MNKIVMEDIPNKLNGIIGVINTPFTEDDQIDTDSLRGYVRYGIDCGVVGFLVPAMAAEVGKLTYSERNLIVGTVIDESKGKVVIIGGASAIDQNSRIKMAKSLIELGCDAILIAIPYDNEDNFCDHISEIARLDPKCLMIQDWDFEGYGIPASTILKLFKEIEVFKCLKVEVVPAGVKYSEVITATEGKLHVSGGWAGEQMIEALDRGVNAFMPTILLDVYNKIYRLHRDGERETAKKIFYELLTILVFSHQHLDISIHFCKRFMHKLGVYSTSRVREPILPFDQYHERVADELLNKAVNLMKSLDNI